MANQSRSLPLQPQPSFLSATPVTPGSTPLGPMPPGLVPPLGAALRDACGLETSLDFLAHNFPKSATMPFDERSEIFLPGLRPEESAAAPLGLAIEHYLRRLHGITGVDLWRLRSTVYPDDDARRPAQPHALLEITKIAADALTAHAFDEPGDHFVMITHNASRPHTSWICTEDRMAITWPDALPDQALFTRAFAAWMDSLSMALGSVHSLWARLIIPSGSGHARVAAGSRLEANLARLQDLA